MLFCNALISLANIQTIIISTLSNLLHRWAQKNDSYDGERAVIEVICQSSPFHTNILNRGIWFRRALLFRMSNTSSSRPEQPHVLPKTRRHTVNTNRLRCITVDRKSRNSMLSFTLFLFSLAGNRSCFFPLIRPRRQAFCWISQLMFDFRYLDNCFRPFITKREKRIEAVLTVRIEKRV